MLRDETDHDGPLRRRLSWMPHRGLLGFIALLWALAVVAEAATKLHS